MRARRSTWLQNPAFDLLFFSSLWLVPVAMLAGRSLVAPGVMLVFLAVVYGPHIVSTVHQAPRLPTGSRGRLLSIVVPAVLWVLFTLPAAAGSLLPANVGELLLVVATVSGVIHVGLQNTVILDEYRRRSGATASAAVMQRERRIFLLLIIAASESVISPLVGRNDAVKAFVDVTQACFEVAVLFCVIGYLFNAARSWKQPVTSVPSVLFLLSAVVAMVPWPMYGATHPLQLGLFFLVFNAHHSLASLGLSFLAKREGSTARLTAKEFGTFFAPMAAVSVLALWIATNAFTLRGLEQLFSLATIERAMLMLNGFFVLHYYFEALAWSSKRGEVPASQPVVQRGLRVAG